CQQYYSDPNSF
nr:immunoglobulin light chain junction region [Macaca mulatta]MOW40994.1 immunoglobulin light chain junction region [Macaca mulatta]MOW41022.1 immunoglobulin light chain junction region [Macaca mulatta]MOW41036.1 immunoglobulin light chain junction region [Macaca mulatta]MOW41064.1 immunoglobulin light chain junction region [Macaca mulatta]